VKRVILAAGLLLMTSAFLLGQLSVPPTLDWEERSVFTQPLPGTPQATTAAHLTMATLAGSSTPGDFLLLSTTSNRFGPYPYEAKALIGSERFPYQLIVDSDREFRLENPRQHTITGPFRYESGSAIPFAQTTLVLHRLPAEVVVALPPRTRNPSEPALAMAALTPATAQALTQLRAKLATIYNRLANETATRSIEGMPTTRGITGTTRPPTIQPSVRDRENARRRAETVARLQLETFQRDHLPLRPEAIGQYTYRFPRLAVGQYVLGVLQRTAERDPLSAAPATFLVWWTTVTINEQEKISFTLTDKNACDWAGIFQFPSLEPAATP
jgi:hypothetical protein